MHITPKVADALRAFDASSTQQLTRCAGGYRPEGGPHSQSVRVTMRTIRTMHRDYLVQLYGTFGSAAGLTDKGQQALSQLQAQAQQARAS